MKDGEEEGTAAVALRSRQYPPLKQQCSFPYYPTCMRHSCIHRYNFTPKWQRTILNKFEREQENLVCISPPTKDSYEVLCNISICEAKAPVPIKQRKPFNVVHCVFCNLSLYSGGTIYDLRDTVPAVKRQSIDQDDDVAHRIGFRTRITVHKSCFEKYIERTVSYLLDDDGNDCRDGISKEEENDGV